MSGNTFISKRVNTYHLDRLVSKQREHNQALHYYRNIQYYPTTKCWIDDSNKKVLNSEDELKEYLKSII